MKHIIIFVVGMLLFWVAGVVITNWETVSRLWS